MIKTSALAFAVALAALAVASPVLARSGYHHKATGTQGPVWQHEQTVIRRGAENAYGMALGGGLANPNSPMLTGGGSLGYNQKLLIF